MSQEEAPRMENEPNPERALTRFEILGKLSRHCEKFKVEREIEDAEGIYLLEVVDEFHRTRYIYQRKGSFPGRGHEIKSVTTTILEEDIESGYSKVVSDYDAASGWWIDQ